MPELTRDTIVAFLGDIFARRGGEEYLGEPVTMAQHMLQGATFAQQQGLSEEIIVAALLHDVGQVSLASEVVVRASHNYKSPLPENRHPVCPCY